MLSEYGGPSNSNQICRYVIGEDWFRWAYRTGLTTSIPCWEHGNRGNRGA